MSEVRTDSRKLAVVFAAMIDCNPKTLRLPEIPESFIYYDTCLVLDVQDELLSAAGRVQVFYVQVY